ncbi:MAG: hypothetical protein K0S08_1929 [Gammaproteobacteria bacterium]|jgi:hypothetical protein|nr:hypothetical protein [Gammaproteobacteria bacterium]
MLNESSSLTEKSKAKIRLAKAQVSCQSAIGVYTKQKIIAGCFLAPVLPPLLQGLGLDWQNQGL